MGRRFGNLSYVIMLNAKITLYIKDNFYYKKYFEFVGVEEPTDYIDLIFKSSNHFDILYKKNHIFKRKLINKEKQRVAQNTKNKKQFLKFINSKINHKIDSSNIKEILHKNQYQNQIGKGLYVDYNRNNYTNKYNDIYKFLKDKNYVPDKFKSEIKTKKIDNKRTSFRKYCRKNFFIKGDRLYYKYKRNNCTVTDVKIPFKEEIFPILKNLHIEYHHCGYKPLSNHIIQNGYYWEGYTQDVRLFLSKCEICNAEKKTHKIIAPLKIITDEGPNFRYVVDIWDYRMNYLLIQNIYTFWIVSIIFLNF